MKDPVKELGLNEKSLENYLSAFGWDSENPSESLKYEANSRLAKAYETALDIRKFEIELYWKRSGSFWLIITAISAALGVIAGGAIAPDGGFALSTRPGKEIACLVLSLAGTVLCGGWAIGNRSSKFWQRNWESQVDLLEQKVLGPLYKTVLLKKDNFRKTIHISVSTVNMAASIYFMLAFFAIAMYFCFSAKISMSTDGIKKFIVFANAIYVFAFFIICGVKTNHKNNNLDVELEATTRAVFLSEIYASTKGGTNLQVPTAGPRKIL